MIYINYLIDIYSHLIDQKAFFINFLKLVSYPGSG